MRRQLAAWRELSGAERRQLIALACGLPLVELSVRCVGARRTSAWLSFALPPALPRPVTPDDVRRSQRLVQLAGIASRRAIPTARCLAQSLLARAVLRRRGLDAILRFGVRYEGDRFDAHAWLELDGRPLAPVAPHHRPMLPPNRPASTPR